MSRSAIPSPSIGILIPCYKGFHHLKINLPSLIKSPLKPKILLIDSSSHDGSFEFAQECKVNIEVIKKKDFHHGKVREWGRKILNTDIILMLTQDAYLISPTCLENLIAPLLEGKASAAYARQIPHANANFLASFARQFNYPQTSQLRSLKDTAKYGAYTFFCSNSCAAYWNKHLDEIGGIPPLEFGEDTATTALLLQKGYQVAYVADAVVAHSHNYTIKEEFLRHLTIGKTRKELNFLSSFSQHDYKRGTHYTLALFQTLLRNRPLLIPYASLHTSAKLLGYLIGKFFL